MAESDLSHLHFPYIRDSTSYSFFENFAINTEKKVFRKNCKSPKMYGEREKRGKGPKLRIYFGTPHFPEMRACTKKGGAI